MQTFLTQFKNLQFNAVAFKLLWLAKLCGYTTITNPASFAQPCTDFDVKYASDLHNVGLTWKCEK